MKLQRLKCLQKLCYDLNISRTQLFLFVAMLFCVTIGLWMLFRREFAVGRQHSAANRIDGSDNVYTFEPIDAVYTWVNGSDPAFIDSVRLYNRRYEASRFHDKSELKYSLRSIALHAPWIRHIYIVTNGQIPHWLDLENPDITVVSHTDLCAVDGGCPAQMLPTFSSAGIETLLHRIPKLSKRFLYLNDDVYIGCDIYPDDLYTYGGGVTVFTAWNVPECATDCPWSYIGDGSCDSNCNTEACQFDGGDCTAAANTRPINDEYDEFASNMDPNVFLDIPKVQAAATFLANAVAHNESAHIQRTVDAFNARQLLKQRRKRHNTRSTVTINRKVSVDSKDAYASSLIHTNRVLNVAYGFKQRKVIGHVGFLLDRNVIEELLHAHPVEFERTQSHRFRNANDMQFAFAYYHHLMEAFERRTIAEIFDDFDTDQSGTWSDREVRTLLTRIYALPLSWGAVRFFEDIVINCTVLAQNQQQQQQHSLVDILTPAPAQPTILYERYQDSSIPRISKAMIVRCSPLTEILNRHFGQRPKYRFTVNTKTSMHSNFKMLTSNVTYVVDALDQLRRNPKKFNCINDNLDAETSADGGQDNDMVLALLEDFYASIFPARGPYELPEHYRNRFTHIDDYREWQRHKRHVMWAVIGVLVAVICGGGAVRLCCCRHRAGRLVRTFIVI